MRLPGAGGIDLVSVLRKRRPNLPVIFATGQAEKLDVIPDRQTMVLIKPYGAGRLAELVAMLLGGSASI
jgi:CheY-like chemotaxis protein